MSVNLSALQFRRAGLVEIVAGALVRSGLPPHLLELELTETILFQPSAGTSRTASLFAQAHDKRMTATRDGFGAIESDAAFDPPTRRML